MTAAKVRRQNRPLAVDLFCGAGGMSLGFEQAGFDVILGVDADGHHAATHARNFPQSVTLCQSIVDLTAEHIYAALGGQSTIDLVFGGPPCQGFSHMGTRDADDPRNTLVDEFTRLIAELQPRAFVMENVPGLLTGKMRPVLDRAVGSLLGAGYRIAEPIRVLDAADFGVPQHRKRLFVLGLRADQVGRTEPGLLFPDLGGTIPYPNGPCPGQPHRPSVWEALSDLPTVEDHEELFTRDDVAYDKAPTGDYARVARGAVLDPSDFSHPREWPGTRCTGCLRVRHTEAAAAVYAATPPGQMVPGHKLPRLDPDGLAPTLRAGSDSTHGSYTAPRPIHPYEPRCITAREAARLHGFPDWFGFYPLKWHAYRQIGNSVCPPVARAIGREILAVLGCVHVKPRQPILLTGEFVLPEDRPRTRKRIPHLANYPPVIQYLFEQAYDSAAGQLRRPRFTFADVQKAIQVTGVNLSWTRADTFLPEIARSRNVRRILEPCLSRGYSIRSLRERDVIGEFVQTGEPGTVEDKDAVQVRSRDLAEALALPPSVTIDPEQSATFPLLLAEADVVTSLWKGRKLAVEILGQVEERNGGLCADYQLRNGRGVVGRGSLVVSTLGSLPTRTRLGRLAETANVEEVIAIVPITVRHVLVSRFEDCRTNPREVCRLVYEMTTPVEDPRES